MEIGVSPHTAALPPHPRRGRLLSTLGCLVLAVGTAAGTAGVASVPGVPDQPAPMVERVQALVPELEAYAAAGMNAFDVPGAAVGIVTGDRLAYAKGFGARTKAGAPVDSKTVFQVGSTTKAFLAATIAIAVDGGRCRWDDRVVDLYPAFQLRDPWVTREFRVFDLLAQRSGLPPYVNDGLAFLGYGATQLIRSLREVEPVTSFRSAFAYVNILHLLAGRIVAERQGKPDWNAVAREELLEPLGMNDTTFTAEAIASTPNHATGHRWTPQGSAEVPFEPFFPYELGPAGLNSCIEILLNLCNSLQNGEDRRHQ